MKRKLLTQHMGDQREARLLELLVIVNAIREGAKLISGQSPGTQVGDALGSYRELLFPELREEKEAKAKSSKELLKREFEAGAFQVKAIDTNRKHKKQQRRRK